MNLKLFLGATAQRLNATKLMLTTVFFAGSWLKTWQLESSLRRAACHVLCVLRSRMRIRRGCSWATRPVCKCEVMVVFGHLGYLIFLVLVVGQALTHYTLDYMFKKRRVSASVQSIGSSQEEMPSTRPWLSETSALEETPSTRLCLSETSALEEKTEARPCPLPLSPSAEVEVPPAATSLDPVDPSPSPLPWRVDTEGAALSTYAQFQELLRNGKQWQRLTAKDVKFLNRAHSIRLDHVRLGNPLDVVDRIIDHFVAKEKAEPRPQQLTHKEIKSTLGDQFLLTCRRV